MEKNSTLKHIFMATLYEKFIYAHSLSTSSVKYVFFTIKMSYSYFLFCQVVQHLYVLDPIQSSKMYEMPINMKSELFPLAFVRN